MTWTLFLLIALFVALIIAVVVAANYRGRVQALTAALADTHSGLRADIATLREAVMSIASGGDLKTIISRLNSVGTLVKRVVDDMRSASEASAMDTPSPAAAPTADQPATPASEAAEAPPPGFVAATIDTTHIASADKATAPGFVEASADPLGAIDAEMARLKARRDRMAKAMDMKRAAEEAGRAADAELAELMKG